jgi:hypothetical protein
MMTQYSRQQLSESHWRYASHTFADKTKILPLQAADLYAWQIYTLIKNNGMDGRPTKVRKDLKALLRWQDQIDVFHTERLQMYAEHVRQVPEGSVPPDDFLKGREAFIYKSKK